MKDVLLAIGLASIAASIAAGQTPVSPSAGAQPAKKSAEVTARASDSVTVKIDPAKEADIRRLLEITGAKELAIQIMGEMSQSLKPMLTNSLPPGEYREKLVALFFEKFMAKAGSTSLLDLAIPEYDKDFTREEIQGLMQFYQTPLGKKAITVLPQLTSDLQKKGRKWGEDVGRQSMLEVLAEHPEFQQQIAEARKAAQHKN
jgi:uncharacterized protein